MAISLLTEAEAEPANDPDGSCKAQLVALVEKYRDEFAFARQGFLPSDAYVVAEHRRSAVQAALTVIRDYEASAKGGDGALPDSPSGGGSNTMINIQQKEVRRGKNKGSDKPVKNADNR